MLTARKHLDLNSSALRVSAIVLKELNKRGVMEMERLRGVVLKRVGVDGDIEFLPSLNLLFLLGRLQYHVKNDTVELTVK